MIEGTQPGLGRRFHMSGYKTQKTLLAACLGDRVSVARSLHHE